MQSVRVAVLAALLSIVPAAPALAQQDEGVFIDPDSPTIKEYAIPLEAERRQADPSQPADEWVQRGSRTSPLFGTGIITRDAATAPARGSRADNRQRRAEATMAAGVEPQARGADHDARLATVSAGAPDGGAGALLGILGLAIGVVLVGGLLGLLLRRSA